MWAAWCGSGRDWQPVLKRWAVSHPGPHVMWVDIEDEADWLAGLTGTMPPSTALSEGAKNLASQLWLRQQAHTSLRLG